MAFGQTTMQVHFVHFDSHGTVKHLSGKRECCFIHVHRSHNDKVWGDRDTVFIETCSYFVIRRDRCRQVEIPFGIFLFQDGVGSNDSILTAFARLYHAQIFRKVLLHWSQVHLVEAKKVWSILVFPSLCHELQEVASHKLRLSTHSAHIANEFAGVMPVRLHLYHFKVLWFLHLVFIRIFFPTSTCQLPYDSTLACTGYACKEKKRFRLDCGNVGTIVGIRITYCNTLFLFFIIEVLVKGFFVISIWHSLHNFFVIWS